MLRLFVLLNLLLLLFGFSVETVGQDRHSLLLIKNYYHQARYEVGDRISFKVHGDQTKHSDVISGIEDSLVVFSGFKLSPREISHVYVDEKTIVWFVLRYKYERIFFYSGVGYLTLDVINSGELEKNTAILSGSLILAGVIAHYIIKDTIRMNGRRRLAIISSSRLP